MIHVFTKTPPTQGSRKVVRFMQNEPQFILYRAQRMTNVNIWNWHLNKYAIRMQVDFVESYTLNYMLIPDLYHVYMYVL